MSFVQAAIHTQYKFADTMDQNLIGKTDAKVKQLLVKAATAYWNAQSTLDAENLRNVFDANVIYKIQDPNGNQGTINGIDQLVQAFAYMYQLYGENVLPVEIERSKFSTDGSNTVTSVFDVQLKGMPLMRVNDTYTVNPNSGRICAVDSTETSIRNRQAPVRFVP